MKKKEVARELFLKGNTHSEIAAVVGVPKRTIEDWSQQGKWMAGRAEASMMEETRTEQILEIIDYNLSVLRARVAEYRAESFGSKLIDKDDVAGLVAMYQTVKGAQNKLTENMKLLKRVVEYINRESPEAAKAAIVAVDMLVTDLIREG